MASQTVERRYRVRLVSELLRRQKKNPLYSLRSFARDLELSPATLSQVFNRKRDLSRRNLIKVSQRLGFSPSEIQSAVAELEGAAKHKLHDESFTLLPDDVFRCMSDWYYFAILSLASSGRAKASPRWLAERLNLTRLQATAALARLRRMKLIEVRDGFIRPTGGALRIHSDLPSSAARNLQHDHLRLAEDSLEKDPIDRRDMTSMTMLAKVDRIPRAKQMIKSFRRKLTRYLEADGDGEEVYVLALQLFPVSRRLSP